MSADRTDDVEAVLREFAERGPEHEPSDLRPPAGWPKRDPQPKLDSEESAKLVEALVADVIEQRGY